MAPYKPGEQPRAYERLIKLNTNENPYPPSPRVRRAVARAVGASLRLYPAPRGDEFVQAASRLYRIPADMILAGNGSDELLAMIFRAAVGSSNTVAYPVPTYSLYDTLADIQEARVLRIPTGPSFKVPIAELSRARARLTIICNPNSPSGTLTPVGEIAVLARQLRGRMLVVDEAYVDFARDCAMRLLRGNPNLVILRTLSKSFSLAGMRLGLCFANPAVIAELLKVKDSYNLSRIALAAGAAALEDADWMRRNVERVRKTRGETERKLRALGFDVPPSEANFVLARMPGRDMGPVARSLRRAGILVRHFATPDLRDALRISIGKPSEMRLLLAVLRNVVPSASPGHRKQG
jgi:histidinol-phosphate aminotransferase